MTLAKLAELSGVSVGTVSKAFKGSPEISKKTRDKIFNIAKKHGCFNKYYRSPRTRPVIALLAPEPESEYYGREIGILERALFLRGADTVIAFTRFSPEKEARLFGILAYEMKVQGFILWSSGNLIKNPDQIPLVTLASGEKSPENSDVIRIDTNSAILELAKTVKEYGHSRVGFIGEKLTNSKEKKLKMALRSVGIPVHDKYFINSDKRFMEAGMDGMSKLIKSGNIPSVIITAYDEIAYGAIRCAENAGYKIPDDISFIGMDDLCAAPFLNVPLSSIHTDLEETSALIADLIFKRIENKYYREKSEITVPVTLKLRESLKDLTKQKEELL